MHLTMESKLLHAYQYVDDDVYRLYATCFTHNPLCKVVLSFSLNRLQN